jgi:5'-methylthioinosine phosphorylase
MSKIAIIAGAVLPYLKQMRVLREEHVNTPYGETSSPLMHTTFADQDVIFLDRHGLSRSTAPHKINYRANIWALHALGVSHAIGISIVGGIRADMTPGHFAFPDQLIDYTTNRPSTFYDNDFNFARHIDFTYPYCRELHTTLVDAAQELNLDFSDNATYGVTQGPRFETLAEVNRLERDGCDIIGMTSMPEAVLARELALHYACLAIVGTKAAGRSDGFHVDIGKVRDVVDASMAQMVELLDCVIRRIN